MLTHEKKNLIKQSGYRSGELVIKKTEALNTCNIIESILQNEIIEISRETKAQEFDEIAASAEKYYFDSQ